jgi:hypothetical protein
MRNQSLRALAIVTIGLLALTGAIPAAQAVPSETASIQSIPTPEDSKQAFARLMVEHGQGKEQYTIQAFTCTRNWRMRNVQNNRLVAAERAYQGAVSAMLRARTPVNQTDQRWETFDLCQNSANGDTLFRWTYGESASTNHRLVAAEYGYRPTDSLWGMMRARTPINQTNLPWETFRFRVSSDGWLLIYNPYQGRYVAAELGYATSNARYGMLRARTPANQSVLRWERFDLF